MKTRRGKSIPIYICQKLDLVRKYDQQSEVVESGSGENQNLTRKRIATERIWL